MGHFVYSSTLLKAQRSESVYNPAYSDSKMKKPFKFSMKLALPPTSRQTPSELFFRQTIAPRPIAHVEVNQ